MREHYKRPRYVLRGGSWGSHPENLSPPLCRDRTTADNRDNLLGFRLVYREPPVDDRRVLRGGSWYFRPGSLRSALRSGLNADDWDGDIGFRLVYREKPHV